MELYKIKIMIKKISLLILAIFIPLYTGIALAKLNLDDKYRPSYAPSVIIDKGNEADYGNYFLQLIAGGLLYLAAPIAVITIAIGGLLYVVARGDQTQLDKAKKTVTWAIIGLIIIIFSFTIVKSVIQIIYNTNNINQPVQTEQSQNNQSSPANQSTGKDANGAI